VVRVATTRGYLSSEHFTVDGTLIEAWASFKGFRPRGEDRSQDPPDDPSNPTVDFRGERRCNATHQSRTDPEAMLAKKGRGHEAHLSYRGQRADGEPEWDAGGLPDQPGHRHRGA
jgi:hypothetical protein